MKKLFLFLGLLFSLPSYAANGDTTWVTMHNGTWLTYYGNFDTVAQLPDASKTYQKIILEWTIGKYVCPGSPQYCSDWDYDVHFKIIPPPGITQDTLEIARLITPYGNGPRMGANWTHRYYFDVTDYYPLLQDSVTARIFYSGYSGGFTATSRLCFIEGTPPKNVLSIQRLWTGGKEYGNPNVSIDSLIKPVNVTVPALTESATLKVYVTGHGADNTGCSEFCSKWYEVVKDNSVLYQNNIWKNDCGLNSLYPQNGTWIYDRANWCPGEKVAWHEFDIPNVTALNPYDLDLNFQPYTRNGGTPSYNVEAQIFHYGAMNKTTDVRLDEIMAPSDYEGHFRSNPICGTPKIKVTNEGNSTINSLTIRYEFPRSSGDYSYTSNVNLLPNQSTEITLPAVPDLVQAQGDSNIIKVTIEQVNGAVDDDLSNNSITQQFTATPHWPNRVIVQLRTNNTLHNNWYIYDNNGQIVHQRGGVTANTWFRDTITLAPGCYRLQLTDAGCDGLRWWANSAQGNGTFKIFSTTQLSTPIPLKGFYYTNNVYEGDFGCEFNQNFVIDEPQNIQELKGGKRFGFSLMPNPAQDEVIINLINNKEQETEIILSDLSGKTIEKHRTRETQYFLYTTSLASGVYIITCKNGDFNYHQRLVISK